MERGLERAQAALHHLRTVFVLCLLFGAVNAGLAATYTVTSTADSGTGTLRGVLGYANSNTGPHIIRFNIPGSGPFRIVLGSSLGQIQNSVTIDGTTQPGYSEKPIIEISPANGVTGDGFYFIAPSNTVRGLVINGFSGGALRYQSSDYNVIEGNYLGTDVSGTVAIPNGNGLKCFLSFKNGRIGGTNLWQRNVISGNSSDGINAVNFDNNLVQGNFIGTDMTGTLRLPNGGDGISLKNATGNLIGGTAPGEANVIAGNTGHGISLANQQVVENFIQGNLIGTDLTRTFNLSNRLNGISILVPAMNNLIGGTNSGEGNIIWFNGQAGISATAGTNFFFGNSIQSNAALGIDLGTTSIAVNDNGDTDSGPNGLQNFPILASASAGFGATVIQGTLNSLPSTEYRLEFFASAACDASGNGEGHIFLGAAHVRTGPNGSTNFSVTLPNTDAVGKAVTATATHPGGGTSEFSPCLSVTSLVPVITTQPAGKTVNAGQSITLQVGASGQAPLHYQWLRNGIALSNATNAALTLASFQATNSGTYSVIVYNDFGTAVSQGALASTSISPVAMTNNFSFQVTLTASSGTGRASNHLATAELGEPMHAGKAGGNSLWITWKSPGTGIATFRTAGSSFDTLLAVYQGNNVSNLVHVASDDDSGPYYSSTVSFNTEAGALYRIAVDGVSGAYGSIVLSWSYQATTDILPNVVVGPSNTTVSAGSSVQFQVQAILPDVLYQWFFNGAPIAGATTNRLSLANVDESNVGRYWVRLTRGTRSVTSPVAHLQLNQTGEAVQNVLALDKWSDARSFGNLLRVGETVATAAAPVSKAIPKAAGPTLGYSGSQVFSTYGAVSEPNEPVHCGVVGGASQWFAYQATAAGTMYMNTDGSSFDTILAVYTGSGTDFSSLQPVTCDNNSGLDGRDSKVEFQTQPGAIYYIVVDGVKGATGTVKLNYSLATPARLTLLPKAQNGANRVRISGQSGGRFALQTSQDLKAWAHLLTTNAPGGTVDCTDNSSLNVPARFYRAVTLP